jgi:hypothetical protein
MTSNQPMDEITPRQQLVKNLGGEMSAPVSDQKL